MTARRPPARLLATLMAFMAIAGMFAVSTWHTAHIHDDDPMHLVSTNHVQPDSQGADPEAAVHVAAHAVGQGLAAPVVVAVALTFQFTRQRWTAAIAALRPGSEPASLLRPPRD